MTRCEAGPWGVIETRPWTVEEFNKESEGFYARNLAEVLKEKPLKEVRGYLPSRDLVSTQETEVLKQTVEELDLAAVIKAINKL